MRRLRRTLSDLVNTGTGHRHLLTVAIEARALMMPHQRMLVGLLESARLPLSHLSHEREDLGRRLEILKSAIGTIREQFEAALQHHVRVTERSFQGLADLLRIELIDEIRNANLANEKDVNRLEVRKAQLLQEWVANRGPGQVWEGQFQEFSNAVLDTVRTTLLDASRTGDLGANAAPLGIRDLAVPPTRRYRPGARDYVQQVSGIVGISTPFATMLAAVAGLITGPVIVVPTSVALIAGLLYAYIARNRANSSELKVLRQQWIDELDETANTFRESFAAAAYIRGSEMIDRAMEILSERTEELSRRIILVEARLAEPDYADRGELVATLEPHVRSGTEILEALRTLS
jgi:hypothetical protein